MSETLPDEDLTARPNGVLQQEPERLDTVMIRTHEIYGPALVEALGGDPYKVSFAIGILSNHMTLEPGQYIGLKDKKFNAISGGKS